MGIREGLLAEYDHEMASTRRVLGCIPAALVAWRPHERSRSMGALAAHIVEVLGWSAQILELPRFDLDDAPAAASEPESMTALLEVFGHEVSRTRARLDRSDVELATPWSLRQGGSELFSVPRAAAFRTLVLSHVVHHRGQLSVYLRLNDIPVPAIYGPTADAAKARP